MHSLQDIYDLLIFQFEVIVENDRIALANCKFVRYIFSDSIFDNPEK